METNKDPLEQIFVKNPELDLPNAKIRLREKEIEIENLNNKLTKLQSKFDKRERLLEVTENNRNELLKDYDIMRKNLRNYERIDNLEIEVNKLKDILEKGVFQQEKEQ